MKSPTSTTTGATEKRTKNSPPWSSTRNSSGPRRFTNRRRSSGCWPPPRRAEAEAARSGPGFGPEGDDPDETGLRSRRRVRGSDDFDGYTDYAEYEDDGEFGDYPPYGPYGPYGGALRPYRSSTRWHRPVAWVLAVVMGIGLVALAFSAVYRGSSGRTQSPAPAPTSSGVDAPATGVVDSVRTARPGLPSAEPLRPSFPAVPKPH